MLEQLENVRVLSFSLLNDVPEGGIEIFLHLCSRIYRLNETYVFVLPQCVKLTRLEVAI